MASGFARKLDPGWVAASVLAIVLVGLVHRGTLLGVRGANDPDEIPTIAKVRDLIVQDWVEDPATRRERLRYGAVEGMAAQLDPYSEFIPPEKKDRFDEDVNGEFGGLGVLIQIENGQVVIVAPYEDTPAWEAGILPGDRVLEIDHQTYRFQNQDEATRRLRGKVGTTVELLVTNPQKRPEPALVKITRAVIKVQSVKGTRYVDEGIGYARITQFQEPTLDEFDRAIASLTSAAALRDGGLTGLILDLRGNPGGYLNKATDIAARFVDENTVVVVTRGRGGKDETQTLAHAPKTAPRLRLPVAVLIDGGSASASEVLAGCLQDHGVATLVGARSFGKGSVQSLFPIDQEKAKLKLTTHYYCTPKGRQIHRVEGMTDEDRWGLLPDIAVPLDAKLYQEILKQESDLELEALKSKRGGVAPPIDRSKLIRDPQLEAAVRHLQRVLKGEEKLGPQPRTNVGDGVAVTGSRTSTPKRAPPPPPQGPGGG